MPSPAISAQKQTRSDRRRISRSQPSGRLQARWQRLLIWGVWLFWVALLWRNSGDVRADFKEYAAMIGALAVTVWCVRRPMGPPASQVRNPEMLRGEFESRINWALLLIGAALLLGGIASTIRIITHLATGFATLKDVFTDMAVFIEGMIAEKFTGSIYDAELEKTQAYILFLLVIPGLLLVIINLNPWFSRGSRFRILNDGPLFVLRGEQWEVLKESEYAVIDADGTNVTFKVKEDSSAPALLLPMGRVFCRENGQRIESKLIAAFFRRRLERLGWTVECRSPDGMVETSWIARRQARKV